MEPPHLCYYINSKETINMNSTLLNSLKLPLLLIGLIASQSALSETRVSLPRDIQGLEILVGMGASYDNSAPVGEKETTDPTPALALMTKDFYLDIHEISYRKSLNKDLYIKFFGKQDGNAADDDIKIQTIKKGESFEVGISVEKRLGTMSVGGLLEADVTGTHSGYMLEASLGKEFNNKRHKFGVTAGGRYQDKKRNNYYFGVAKDEAYEGVPEYEVDGETTAFANATYAYQITRHLGLIVDANISTLSSQAKKSPRIKDDAKFFEQEAFVGLVWQFSVYK